MLGAGQRRAVDQHLPVRGVRLRAVPDAGAGSRLRARCSRRALAREAGARRRHRHGVRARRARLAVGQKTGSPARAAWLLGAADPLWERGGSVRFSGTAIMEEFHQQAAAAARRRSARRSTTAGTRRAPATCGGGLTRRRAAARCGSRFRTGGGTDSLRAWRWLISRGSRACSRNLAWRARCGCCPSRRRRRRPRRPSSAARSARSRTASCSTADGAPLLVMTSGAHRVDTSRVAALVGAGVGGAGRCPVGAGLDGAGDRRRRAGRASRADPHAGGRLAGEVRRGVGGGRASARRVPLLTRSIPATPSGASRITRRRPASRGRRHVRGIGGPRSDTGYDCSGLAGIGCMLNRRGPLRRAAPVPPLARQSATRTSGLQVGEGERAVPVEQAEHDVRSRSGRRRSVELAEVHGERGRRAGRASAGSAIGALPQAEDLLRRAHWAHWAPGSPAPRHRARRARGPGRGACRGARGPGTG